MVKEVPLTQACVAIVDDEDYELVSQFKWCAFKSSNGDYYATTRMGKTHMQMHRILTKAPRGCLVDHRNHNTLDNRKCNIRVCTQSQNQANQKVRKGYSSKYKGVSLDKRDNKWRASITFMGKYINLGRYETEEEAAAAYDCAARKYHGEFAHTNSRG